MKPFKTKQNENPKNDDKNDFAFISVFGFTDNANWMKFFQ